MVEWKYFGECLLLSGTLIGLVLIIGPEYLLRFLARVRSKADA